MAEQEPNPKNLTKAELRARFIGNSLERDKEDIEFWRHASEAQRGRTLYRLLRMAQNIVNSKPPRPEEPLMFPGFPKRRTDGPSAKL